MQNHASPEETLLGRTVSHYRVLRKIGGGGMGVVFEAEDLNLGRRVALKFIPEDLARDPAALERFRQEARTASSLNHPNICIIHEIGEAEGQVFIAMELLEGHTLREHLRGRPLPLDELLDFAVQIASGLEAAHVRNIVHRDIKPANIFVTSSGQVKLLDFGLAKQAAASATGASAGSANTASQRLTDHGATVGTLGYMAPEQALGKKVDARTDLFSTGVVLYEMATGIEPFRGDTPHAVMDAVLHGHPAPPARLNPAVPPKLDELILKTIEKDPEIRCQSAAELRADLKRLKRDSESGRMPPAVSQPGPHRRLAVEVALGLLAVIMIAAGAIFWYLRSGSEDINSIAVLPFVNVPADADTEYLSDGVTEGLINSLSELPHLRVMSRNSVFRYKGRETDAQAAGRALNVQAVLTGRVVQRGNDLAVSVELVDVRNNTHLWGDEYDRKLSDLLTVQNDIARDIGDKLRRKLSGESEKRLTKGSTADPEAYQDYLKGRYFAEKFTRDGVQKGIGYFRQATEHDPNYALAYAGLAYSYGVSDDLFLAPHDAMPKLGDAAKKAIELDDSIAEPHLEMATYYFWYEYDWAAAEKGFGAPRSSSLTTATPTNTTAGT